MRPRQPQITHLGIDLRDNRVEIAHLRRQLLLLTQVQYLVDPLLHPLMVPYLGTVQLRQQILDLAPAAVGNSAFLGGTAERAGAVEAPFAD